MTKKLANIEELLMEAVVRCETYKVEKLIYSEADVNAKHGQVHTFSNGPFHLFQPKHTLCDIPIAAEFFICTRLVAHYPAKPTRLAQLVACPT